MHGRIMSTVVLAALTTAAHSGDTACEHELPGSSEWGGFGRSVSLSGDVAMSQCQDTQAIFVHLRTNARLFTAVRKFSFLTPLLENPTDDQNPALLTHPPMRVNPRCDLIILHNKSTKLFFERRPLSPVALQ